MIPCWLHLGMPKTGSSSIQETLYYELEDSGFVYCGFGEINGTFAMSSLAGYQSYIASIRQIGEGGPGRLFRRRMLGRFQRSLAQARARGAALIISSEFTYGWRPDQHHWLQQFARDHRLDLRIVMYLRPPLDWIASALSEEVKYARSVTHPALTDLLNRWLGWQLDFSARIDTLAEVYGPEALVIRPFLRSQLLDGCVVRDFCRVVGIRQLPDTIHRRNESLSLEASQCLHLHNIARGRPLQGALDLLRRHGLLMQLSELFADRPSLRLQPSVLGKRLGTLQQHLSTLQQRHAIALPLSTAASDVGLTSLDELLSLPASARARLAAVGGDCPPEQILARMERGLALTPMLAFARRRLRRELRHLRRGC